MAEGFATTEMPVTVAAAFDTAMLADPDTFVKPACVDVAVHLPVPVPDGVNTPPCVMVPPVAVHETPVLNAPVPVTLATHVDVCEGLMAAGLATTEIPVTAVATDVDITVIDALLDLVVSCAEVAVQVPVPIVDGVKTPLGVMVPPVAVHVTFEL